MLGLGILLVWRLLPGARILPKITPPDVHVDMAAKGIELSQSREGRVLWRLSAVGGVVDPGSTVHIQQPVVRYYPRADGSEMVARAPQGEVTQGTGIMRLFPQAQATYGPTTLTAAELGYDGKDLLTAKGNVRILRGNTELLAPEAVFDLPRGEFRAQGGVTMTVGSEFGIAHSSTSPQERPQ